MRVNIVLLSVSPAPIGGYKVIYRYANDLAAQGADVHIYHCREDLFFYPGSKVPPAPPTVRLARLFRAPETHDARPTWFELDSRVTSTCSHGLRLKDLRPADVVIATAVRTAPFVAALPGTAGRKFYFIQHWEDWSDGEEFVESTWRLPLRKLVIARWLGRKGDDLGVPTTYLPNAIDLDEFPPGPPVAERPRYVTALVSPVDWKRTDLVIEVLERVRARVPDIRACVFGAHEKPVDLPSWVEFHLAPDKPTLREIYQKSRVYLCASDAEGWHLPPAEALASGSAVVSTDIDGVREYADGIARFAPANDAAALTDAVCGLLADTEAAQASVDRFRARAAAYTPVDAARAMMGHLSA